MSARAGVDGMVWTAHFSSFFVLYQYSGMADIEKWMEGKIEMKIVIGIGKISPSDHPTFYIHPTSLMWQPFCFGATYIASGG